MWTDYLTLAEQLCGDDSGKLTTDMLDSAVQLAVYRYSLDFPRERIADLSANGTAVFDLPSDWDTDISAISAVEYPINEPPERYLQPDEYGIFKSPSGVKFFMRDTPQTAVRMIYSIGHTVDATADTIPATHREPVCCWAAAGALDMLAAMCASQTDSTIQAIHVERGSQSRDYVMLAAKMRQRYRDELGLDEKKFNAASATTTFDPRDSAGNVRLIHKRKR